MAISRGVSLLRFAKGAVDRQNEINAGKQKEADKFRQTQLAFASAAYKADLDRYSRFMKMKDGLTMQGKEGAAIQIANGYAYKAGKGKEEHLAKVKESLDKDPEYLSKLIGNYDRIAKPKPSDYFQNNEWDKLAKARISAEDGITRLLFGGRKHPNMLSVSQIEAREAELRERTGGKDFTKGFAEEMMRMKPLDIEAPEITTKLSTPIILVNKENDRQLATSVEEYEDLIENKGYFKPTKEKGVTLKANEHWLPEGGIITTNEIRKARDADYPVTSQQELILLQAMNPEAYVKAKTANLNRPPLFEYSQEKFGIDITGKAPGIVPRQGFATLPQASQHKGKTIRDKHTRQLLISDGDTWVPKK